MLPVPELQPDQEPFNPDAFYPVHPSLRAGRHTLPLARAAAASAIPDDAFSPSPPQPSPQEEENALLSRALDHALVKEAITSLHIEDDLETEKLRAYDQTQICDIVPDYARFVAAQRDKYAHLLKTNAQRHFFQQASSPYFARASERAHALRNAKIRQFQKETIEKQNQEFLARALRPENLMNDALQTQYRDMILHNLDLLLGDAPADERQSALDDACRELYTKIMDSRLAADPCSLDPILGSAAVRRVFSRDELHTYREAARKAVLSRRLSRKALEWVQNGVSPKEAAFMAATRYPVEAEEKAVLDFFAQHRHNVNRKRCLQTILDIDNAWRALRDAEYNPAAIPGWVRNGDPERLDCIARALAVHEKNGGLHPAPDYIALIEFAETFDPHGAAARLADAKNVYALVDRLGGPDSAAFLAVLRLLLGTSTQADRNWFCALSRARGAYRDEPGDESGDESGDEPEDEAEDGGAADDAARRDRINSFLGMVDECRRLKLQRDGREELDPLETQDIVSECLGLFVQSEDGGKVVKKEEEEGDIPLCES